MGTKNNPGEFDCYANAKPDEPMFVLLARDRLAPSIVRNWAYNYEQGKLALGILTENQENKINEALQCADTMEKWQKANPNV